MSADENAYEGRNNLCQLEIQKMKRNTYDQFAQEYSAVFCSRDENGLAADSRQFFDLIGEVEGLHVLDAGWGEGFAARVLSTRGAKVTAIDISTPLVEIGRSKNPEGQIDFRVADLSRPLPDSEDRFDLTVSNYVLNDVPDYKGFIRTGVSSDLRRYRQKWDPDSGHESILGLAR